MSSKLKFLFFVFSCVCCSCANIVSPQGGEKDILPPYAITSNPKDSSLNFSSHKIIIGFNEFIQVKDPQKSIRISPPLAHPPVAEVNRKNLTIRLDSLQPNTTYTIKAIDAITDITEGNALKTLTYVFSTGTIIDTLNLSGKVLLAQNLQPMKGISVILKTQDINDSNFNRSRIAYYTISDDAGNFRIENIRPGVYSIISFEDTNKNMSWEETELIGFNSSTIEIDSNVIIPPLKLFNTVKPDKDHIVKSSSSEKGIYTLEFEEGFYPESIAQIDFNNAKTSTLYFHADTSNCLKSFIYNIYTSLNPPNSVNLTYTRNKTIYKTQIKTSDKKERLTINTVYPKINENNSITIRFNRPLDTALNNLNKIQMFHDTSKTISRFRYLDRFTIISSNQGVGSYLISIPPGILKDIYGFTNDSLTQNLYVLGQDQVSDLIIHEKSTDHRGVILNLVGVDIPYCSFYTIADSSNIKISNLIPGKYKLTAFEDTNNNGYWDNGNFKARRQPETVLYFKEIELKAGFESEESVQVEK
jgi:uncharacterized protein (DUF2141 family)